MRMNKNRGYQKLRVLRIPSNSIMREAPVFVGLLRRKEILGFQFINEGFFR
jgi:hypothetical protein